MDADQIETRFWSIVDADGLTGLPSDMWAALETLVKRAARSQEMLAVLKEMFCEGPVDVAFAGNPRACDALEERVRAVISKAVRP